jgi:hypothetical protein
LPAALLGLAAVACFVLVAVGAINYSEEDTVMIVGAALIAGAVGFAVLGAAIIVIGHLIGGSRRPPVQAGSG